MKKLKKIKLEKVNGGFMDEMTPNMTCPYCDNVQSDCCNIKTTGSGCDEETLYQCNKCKQWFEYQY